MLAGGGKSSETAPPNSGIENILSHAVHLYAITLPNKDGTGNELSLFVHIAVAKVATQHSPAFPKCRGHASQLQANRRFHELRATEPESQYSFRFQALSN